MANGCQSRFHVAGKDALYEHIVDEANERHRRKNAADTAQKELLGDWLDKFQKQAGGQLRTIESTLDEKRSHLPILHSLRNNSGPGSGPGGTGGMFDAQQQMAKQNQAKLKKFWGPPPQMGFLAERAEQEREIQKKLDAHGSQSEFSLRRRKLVHPDSDDEFD